MPDLRSVLSTAATFALGVGTAAIWLGMTASSEREALEARMDDALGEMRSELRADRRSRSWVLPPRGDVSLPVSTERGSESAGALDPAAGSTDGDAEDAEPPSEEERAAEVAERVAALEEAMRGPDDRSWSAAMAEDVGSALSSYRDKLPADVADGIDASSECSAGICRVEVSYPDGRSLERHGMSFYPPRGLGRGFVRFTNEPETQTHSMLAFYARDGEELP